CITCSYKASSGLLYPLERGFIYVHKPPVHLRFEEISCVNFARGTTTTRSFDFEIETKQGNQYTFSSIEREEYGKLFDFVNAKKLNIKNRGFKEGKNVQIPTPGRSVGASLPTIVLHKSNIPPLFVYEQKKQKDSGGPKRPMSAYMLWLNSSRERIKAENPGISITEISKKAGEMWRQLSKNEKEV
ncbi:hypothetical protein GOODEAATRI_000223, partial [Goodea atripinnis]